MRECCDIPTADWAAAPPFSTCTLGDCMADGFWGSDFVTADDDATDFFTRIVERVVAGVVILAGGFLLAGFGEVMAVGFGVRALGAGGGDLFAGALLAERVLVLFDAGVFAVALAATARLASLPLLPAGLVAADELRVALPIVRLQPAPP